MNEPKQQHYIRIELPPDATPEEIEGLQQVITETVENVAEAYDYDIEVSGGAWYPPVKEAPTEPLSILRTMLYTQRADNSPTDAVMLRDALQDLADTGMSKLDLHIHLERARAINEVALRNMMVEENLLAALDMVTGHVGNPEFRITFLSDRGRGAS